jgi:hypothetical protein
MNRATKIIVSIIGILLGIAGLDHLEDWMRYRDENSN